MEPDREPLRPVPATLEEVRENARYLLPDIQDPESGEPYSYRIIDDTQYQLCAVFTHVRKERYDIFWNHPAGRHCFTIDVTENLR